MNKKELNELIEQVVRETLNEASSDWMATGIGAEFWLKGWHRHPKTQQLSNDGEAEANILYYGLIKLMKQYERKTKGKAPEIDSFIVKFKKK